MSLRVLIVDDEAPARQRLRDLLDGHPDVETIREAANGVDAIAALKNEELDIVFLDVQMPEIDGFAVIDAIGLDAMPLTVFVTAFDQHALHAFEANAVDYLVKPFTDARFGEMMVRATTRLERLSNATAESANEQLAKVVRLLGQREKLGDYWSRFAVKQGDITKFLPAEDIEWIQAAGVYVNIYVQGQEYLFRSTLSAVLERLDPTKFARIHRSTIVKLDAISQLSKRSHGEFDVVLHNGTRLILSRTYRTEFEQRIGQPL